MALCPRHKRPCQRAAVAGIEVTDGDRPSAPGGTILLSLETLTELFEVLSRKQFRDYIDEQDMRRFVVALTREAQWIDVDVRITACRDPKDDKFLSLAVSGRATHIVTGDADLLALHPFQGIRILTPGAFL